ncbi:MAG TPA: hypothetical protein VFH26_02255, partial [Gemmatimonadales bacterium]|nr:hypothetical protein [Gemmatimonadales bacterium]
MSPKGREPRAPIKGAPTTSVSEWIVAIASGALVLALLGFLVYEGVSSPGTPPAVSIEVDSIQKAGPGYLVLFRARNGGRTTAAEVLIEGELEADSGTVERSETTIDYVPAGGEQRGGLYFNRD